MFNNRQAIVSFLVKNRIILLGVFFVGIVSISIFHYIYAIEQAPLVTNVDEKDAAEIVATLKEMGVQYEISEAGKTISVAKNQVESVRLDLLAKGIKSQVPVGFELFNNSDIGLTDFSQKINFQRALEGEITRTIQSIPSVDQVRVHLTLPENNSLLSRHEMPKASVKVAFHDGRAEEKQILGIQSMVAAAVEGLDPSRVTITGFDGVALTKSTINGSVISNIEDQQNSAQKLLVDNINKLLTPIFGEKNISVSVVAEYELEKKKEVTRRLIPAIKESGFLKSRTTDVQNSSSSGDSDNKKYNKQSKDEYVYGDQYVEKTNQPGSLSRISVAVAIYSPLNKNQKLSLERLVKAAVGFEPIRGDQLVLESIVSPISTIQPSSSEYHEVDTLPDVGLRDLNKHSVDPASSPKYDVNNILFRVVAGLLLFMFLVSIYLYLRGPRKNRLNKVQREELLRDIKEWLDIDAASSGRERT